MEDLTPIDEKRRKYIYSTWNVIILVIALLLILAGVIVCIFVVVLAANVLAEQRLCLYNPIEGRGMLTLQSADLTMEWQITYTNLTETPAALYINGIDNSLKIALCGLPSDVGCNTLIPGFLGGKIKSYNGIGLKTYIDDIRKFPPYYDVVIMYPSLKQVKFPLTASCGFK